VAQLYILLGQNKGSGSMWILIWLALNNAGDMKYYHLGTHLTEKECGEQLVKASILVTKSGESIDCLWIEDPGTTN
jgi:hypothetical protein